MTPDQAADLEMDEYVLQMSRETANPTVVLPPEPVEMPTDVDLSETAALRPEMFDEAPPRKSNVYSVRLTTETVEEALAWGEANGYNGISETIRGALERVTR